jgi:hypothetical protein
MSRSGPRKPYALKSSIGRMAVASAAGRLSRRTALRSQCRVRNGNIVIKSSIAATGGRSAKIAALQPGSVL